MYVSPSCQKRLAAVGCLGRHVPPRHVILSQPGAFVTHLQSALSSPRVSRLINYTTAALRRHGSSSAAFHPSTLALPCLTCAGPQWNRLHGMYIYSLPLPASLRFVYPVSRSSKVVIFLFCLFFSFVLSVSLHGFVRKLPSSSLLV